MSLKTLLKTASPFKKWELISGGAVEKLWLFQIVLKNQKDTDSK